MAANATLDAIVHARIQPEAKMIAARPNPTSEAFVGPCHGCQWDANIYRPAVLIT